MIFGSPFVRGVDAMGSGHPRYFEPKFVLSDSGSDVSPLRITRVLRVFGARVRQRRRKDNRSSGCLLFV
jgi:hypothetical protein